MGEYFKAFNLDKRQLIHPHKFGNGLKYGEWVEPHSGKDSATMCALKRLKATAWKGDNVAIVGDSDLTFHLEHEIDIGDDVDCFYSFASESYEDVSGRVDALCRAILSPGQGAGEK